MASPPQQTKIVQLSPFDLMGPVHFTRLLLFFQAPDANHMIIRSHLIASLTCMVKRHPLLTGKVYSPPNGHRYLAFNTTVPEGFDPQRHSMLQFQYLEDDYYALRQGGFAGVPGEAAHYHWLEAQLTAGETDVLPLLAFHVTFMNGGFVLALWSNHAVLDGASTARVMRLWVEALQVVSTVPVDVANTLPLVPMVDVDKEVGFQSWHIPPAQSPAICSECPEGFILLEETEQEDIVSPVEIVSCTFTFSTKGLQRIHRPDGSSTAPFRCAAALLLVAILRARSKAGLIPKNATTATAGIVSSFRDALNVPATALGNYAGYHGANLPLQNLLTNDKPLHTIISDTLEHITTLITTSKLPVPTRERLAWLTHQTTYHNTNPNAIFYGPPPTISPNTSIIFNSWELLGSEAEYVKMLGELQCVRKPHAPTAGQVLFMPVVGEERGEVLRCTVGLEKEAMAFLEGELEGWLHQKDGDLVGVGCIRRLKRDDEPKKLDQTAIKSKL